MRVLYHAEIKYSWPPGREDVDMEMEVADLPPLIQRNLRNGESIESMYGEFYHWEAIGIDMWYWVLPL